MKKTAVFFATFLVAACSWAGAVQHNAITNTNAFHGLHSPGYIVPTSSALAAVTNALDGDLAFEQDSNTYFQYSATCACWSPLSKAGTVTPTWTPTFTPTFTNTPTPTSTFTNTPTGSPTYTPTNTPTPTGSPTYTSTNTFTPTITPTPTLTPQQTLTPIIGDDMILVGRSLDVDTITFATNGSRIQITDTNHGFNAGDFVSFRNFTTTAVNGPLWPVVNATANYLEVQTTVPSITVGGAAKALWGIYNQNSFGLQYLKTVTTSGTLTYIATLTNTQPTATYRVPGGLFISSQNSLIGSALLLGISSSAATFMFVDDGGNQDNPNKYFNIKISGLK